MNRRRVKTIIVLLCAVLLIVLGLLNNQFMEAFRKASKVCLECIGIG